MTPFQTRQRPAPSLRSASADAEVRDLSGPQVCDDMTVEVALSVMVGARVGSLFLCDRDEQVTGSITRTRLVAVRDSSAYTDRLRLRDVLRADRPSAPSVLAGDHGPALGALALSR